MEGVSASIYKGLKGYWRRKGYQKLNGVGGGRRRNTRQIKMGSGSARKKRRVWRIKIGPKLKLGFFRGMPSPKKLLLWLRDSYIRFMIGFANSRVFSTGYGGVVSNYGMTGLGIGRGPLKEYDDKMIIEIDKSLMIAQLGQLVPFDAAKLGSAAIVFRG